MLLLYYCAGNAVVVETGASCHSFKSGNFSQGKSVSVYKKKSPPIFAQGKDTDHSIHAEQTIMDTYIYLANKSYN